MTMVLLYLAVGGVFTGMYWLLDHLDVLWPDEDEPREGWWRIAQWMIYWPGIALICVLWLIDVLRRKS